MEQPFLIGKKLYLRALRAEDLDGPYLAWLNDPETTRFLETGRFPTTRKALEDAVQTSAGQRDSLFLAIVDRKQDRHIGNIKLGPINWVHRHAPLGILIGDPGFRGKGYGREAVEMVIAHGFTTLGLHKISLGVYADHEASVKLFGAAGFVAEGRLRQHLFRDGTYHDKLLMGMLREEFLKRAGAQGVGRRKTSRDIARMSAAVSR